MEVLLIRLFSAVVILGEAMTELLRQLSLNHDDAGSSDSDIALANILGKCGNKVNSIASLKFRGNKLKIYDCALKIKHSALKIKQSIDISSLDISLKYDILTEIAGFSTHIDKKNLKKQTCCGDKHSGKCCPKCNHICSSCKLTYCMKKCCIGEGSCDHECDYCKETLKTCRNHSIVCCNNCVTCPHCAKLLPSQCDLLQLKTAINFVNKLRNLISHLTSKDCDNFKMGKKPFENFPDCKTWESLSLLIKDFMMGSITHFLYKEPRNAELCESLINKLVMALYQESAEKLKQKYIKEISDLKNMNEQFRQNVNEKFSGIEEKLEKFECRMDGFDEFIRVQQKGDLQTAKSIVWERINSNGCVIRLSSNVVVEGIAVKRNDDEWVEISSYICRKCYIYVTMTFEDEQTYQMKVKIETANGFDEACSDVVQFLVAASYHETCIFDVGLICHGNGLVTSPYSVLKKLKKLKLHDPTEVENKVSGCATPTSRVDDIEDWHVLCLEFVARNYHMDDEEAIKLPADCMQDSIAGLFANVLRNWCSGKNAGSVCGMVLSSYDSYKHAKFLGYDLDEMLCKLQISCTSKVDFENRILIYQLHSNVVFNIRIVMENDVDKVMEAMCFCCNDIKVEMILHRDVMMKSNVIFVGLVAVPDVEMLKLDANYYLCKSCEVLLLSYSDLTDVQSFTEWETKNISDIVRRMRKNHSLNKKNHTDIETIYSKVSSRIIGFMATVEAFLPSLNKMPMPTLYGKTHIQVKTVLLTREQQEIVCANENKIILVGSFGSGKSILGQLKMNQLYQRAKEMTKIYYVCCESQCLFESTIKQIAEQTRVEVKNDFAEIIPTSLLELQSDLGLVTDAGISDVMEKVYENEKNVMVHFIFDEYDAEKMDKQEANKINTLLKDDAIPRIEDSTVMIITQSLEKVREYIKIQYGKEKNYPHEKYQLEGTSMKLFELSLTMRTTERINNLLKVCIEKFQNSPCVFNHPEFSKFQRLGDDGRGKQGNNDERILPSFQKMRIRNEPRLAAEKHNDDVRKKYAVVTRTHITSTVPKTLLSENVPVVEATTNSSQGMRLRDAGANVTKPKKAESTKTSLNATIKTKKELKQESSNLDVAFKLVEVHNASSTEKTKTQFKFKGKSTLGHGIKGKKPVLVQCCSKSDENLMSNMYSVLLSSVIALHMDINESMVVLCWDLSSINVLKNAFLLLERDCICYAPAFNERDIDQSKEEIMAKYRASKCILITDFMGFMGMEAEQMLLLLDKSDYYLKQHLVESIGRCTSELMILEYQNPLSKDELDLILEQVVLAWKDKELVTCINIDVLTKPHANRNSSNSFLHLETGENFVNYGLCINSQQYQEQILKLSELNNGSVSRKTDQKSLNESIKSKIHDPYFERSKKNFDFEERNSYERMPDSNFVMFPFTDSGIFVPDNFIKEIERKNDYRKHILQDRFGVKFEIRGRALFMQGDVENKENMIKWFETYNQLKADGSLEDVETFNMLFFGDYFEVDLTKENVGWSSLSFVPPYLFPSIIGRRGENVQKLRREFNASNILLDKTVGKIVFSGSVKSKQKLYSYFRFFMFRKEFVKTSLWSCHEILLIGLQPDDMADIVTGKHCNKCKSNCEFRMHQQNLPYDSENITNFETVLSNLIETVQEELRKNIGTVCDVMVHHGRTHISNCQPGRKRAADILNGRFHFENFSEQSYRFDGLIDEDPFKEIVRYDISVFTPEPSIQIRYKVFLAAEDNKVSFVSYEDAGINPGKIYTEFRIGPGYLCIPAQSAGRVDVVDPCRNSATRINLQMFNQSAIKKKDILFHMQYLKQFYDSLSVENNTTYLKIGNVPDNYLLTYVRRAERKSYKLSKITTLRTSEEKILVKDGLSFLGVREHDIFLTSKLLQGTDLTLASAKVGLEEVLMYSEELMQNIR